MAIYCVKVVGGHSAEQHISQTHLAKGSVTNTLTVSCLAVEKATLKTQHAHWLAILFSRRKNAYDHGTSFVSQTVQLLFCPKCHLSPCSLNQFTSATACSTFVKHSSLHKNTITFYMFDISSGCNGALGSIMGSPVTLSTPNHFAVTNDDDPDL